MTRLMEALIEVRARLLRHQGATYVVAYRQTLRHVVYVRRSATIHPSAMLPSL